MQSKLISIHEINLKFSTTVLIYLLILTIRRLNSTPIKEYIRSKYGNTALKFSFHPKKVADSHSFLKSL